MFRVPPNQLMKKVPLSLDRVRCREVRAAVPGAGDVAVLPKRRTEPQSPRLRPVPSPVRWWLGCLLAFFGPLPVPAAVPALLGHQGRVLVDGAPFDGAGGFKFALVNASGTQTSWLNAADGNADGQPDESVTLTVTRGLYSVALGDTALPHMAVLPPESLAGGEAYLRIWFNDGTQGFQLLAPDLRVTSVGYALIAATVPDGSVSASKLAPGVLSAANLTGVLNPAQLPAGASLVSDQAADTNLLAAGFRRFLTVPSPPWTQGTADAAPYARIGHSGVWTGSQFIIWGGNLPGGGYLGSGAAYEPAPDRWLAVSTVDPPGPRSGHAAAWTGQEMIVWGGQDAEGYPTHGARYDPLQTTWHPLPTNGAPAGRIGSVAVWTGARLVVWGGRNHNGILGDGGVYDGAANTWSGLALPNAPEARFGAVGIWAHTQAVVWGGRGTLGPLGTGARLAFNAGAPSAWSPVATLQAPTARTGHSAVWTGDRMIVWGGKGAAADDYRSDGASYDPVADAWTPLPPEGAPSGRSGHAALWTGSEMLIFGGEDASGRLSSGHAYDPFRGRWRALSEAGNPSPRSEATAAWTGTEVLLFGGQGVSGPIGFLQRLDPQATSHFYTKP